MYEKYTDCKNHKKGAYMKPYWDSAVLQEDMADEWLRSKNNDDHTWRSKPQGIG